MSTGDQLTTLAIGLVLLAVVNLVMLAVLNRERSKYLERRLDRLEAEL
jgi:hypothetical protein